MTGVSRDYYIGKSNFWKAHSKLELGLIYEWLHTGIAHRDCTLCVLQGRLLYILGASVSKFMCRHHVLALNIATKQCHG